jgi:hypothetical protein
VFEKNWKMIASIKGESLLDIFKTIDKLNLDIAGVEANNNVVDLLINDFDYSHLVALGFDVEIGEVKGVSAAPDQQYKNPEEIEFLVKEFSEKFPNITKRVSIGKSLEGRDIWAIKISDNPEVDEVSEPSILFNSMHHAREVMTPEVSLDIIETLLNGYHVDPKITNWIEKNQIWIIPMFNVDGNNKMWNSDKWWRKNNRGGYGVDLNRNYPAGWNKCSGSSGFKYSQTYRGPSPASEPETQAMMDFIKNIRPVFDISYHSYSELVIYPIGCSPERTANAAVVEKIGKEIASKLNYKAGTAWELLYNADGGDIDWMYEAYQVIPYVIELNSRKQGFHPDYDKWRDVTVEKNRKGWMHLLNRLEQSGVRGLVKINGVVEDDFLIKVTAQNKNKVLVKYIGQSTGIFHIVLNPGVYNLEIIQNKKSLGTRVVTIGNNLERIEINI